MLRRLCVSLLSFAIVMSVPVVRGSASSDPASRGSDSDRLAKIQHIVVIYEENHSFDNLYGGWEGVNGRADADALHTLQIGQGGVQYQCLLQNDVNLTSPPLPADCTDTTTATTFTSHFTNAPLPIEPYIPASPPT